ncbi:hypothetical protein ACFQE4_18445 [Streptomyces thermocoprophilus]|uniref:hypothetical protein n=1 Tax=Streptomyces thermocoprophilus TaxID=78356 RepID=UPI003623A10C
MTTRTLLTAPPALAPLLARGALLSPFKRPRPDAGFPATRMVLPGLRVDLARLAAYERVCGFPTGDDALPLTYPHVLGFPLAMRLMSGRDFPLPLLGLVHTSIEIIRHGTLPATGSYELSVHVDRLVPHRRGTEAVVVTELREAGAESGPVWESTSRYLARHRTPGARSGASGGAAPGAGCGTPGEQPPAPRPPSALPAVAEWRPDAGLGRRYGAVSGDRNPIHLHPLTARLFGFPPGHRARHVDGGALPGRARRTRGGPRAGGVQGAGAAAGDGGVRGGRLRPLRAARTGRPYASDGHGDGPGVTRPGAAQGLAPGCRPALTPPAATSAAPP